MVASIAAPSFMQYHQESNLYPFNNKYLNGSYERIVKEVEEEINFTPIMSDPRLLRKAVSDLTVEINKLSKNLEAIVELEEVILVAECECCGLKEECTREYISRIRNSFSGKWVCGLCCEAVKETLTRKPIAIEEAMSTHKKFVQEFNTKSRLNPKLSLTWAMRDIVKRSRENPNKNLGMKKIIRSSSYVPMINLNVKQ